MSVSGLCEICQQREVDGGCDRCGRLVCERHLEASADLCVECYAELRGGRGEGSDPDRGGRGPDGVDTYQF